MSSNKIAPCPRKTPQLDLEARFCQFEAERQLLREQMQMHFVRCGVVLLAVSVVLHIVATSSKFGAMGVAGAAMSMTGILTLTLADFDFDEVCSRRRAIGTTFVAVVAVFFAGLTIVKNACYIFPLVPILYFFARRHQVLDQALGYPRVTQIMTAASFGWAVGKAGGTVRTGVWALGVYYLLAAAAIAALHRHWVRRMGPSRCMWCCIYTWLAALGAGNVFEALALPFAALASTRSNVASNGAAMIVPALAYLCCCDTITSFLAHRFYRGRRLQDGEFIAEMAQPEAARIGDRHDWHDPETGTWHEGRVVSVHDAAVEVQLVHTAITGSHQPTAAAPPSGATSRSRYAIPTAGRNLPAHELRAMALAGLRGVRGDRITLALMQSPQGSAATCMLGQKCEPGEIDFFISHSWHDDPVAKLVAIEQVAVAVGPIVQHPCSVQTPLTPDHCFFVGCIVTGDCRLQAPARSRAALLARQGVHRPNPDHGVLACAPDLPRQLQAHVDRGRTHLRAPPLVGRTCTALLRLSDD
jgi:hypothetical protein